MITGTTAIITTLLRNPVTKEPEDAAEETLSLIVFDPEGGESKYDEEEIETTGTGRYQRLYNGTITGLYHYRWIVNGEAADEGEFTMESEFDTPNEPDLRDLKVLLKRARRKIEGPWGNPRGRPRIDDTQLYGMVADATGEMMMLAGRWWHNTIIVKERDPLVGFPTAWRTENQLTEWEAAVICAQLALDYYYFLFRDMKTSEGIKNEGTEWTYTLSANVLRNYLEGLKSERDRAIEGLRLNMPVMDRMASNIRVRDQATVAVLEWWDYQSPGIAGGGLPGGQESSVVPWFPTDGNY